MITDAQLKAAKKAQYYALRQAERDKIPVDQRADHALRAALATLLPLSARPQLPY